MDGFTLVNALGCLLIVSSLMIVLSQTPKKAACIYAIQSLILVSIFITLGVATSSSELFMWSGTAFITKVVLVPAIILLGLKKMGNPNPKLPSLISPVASMVIVAAEIALCFLAVQSITLPTAAEVKPALAISLAHFFIGLTCIVSQRNILKQVFGYCLMENGSHLTLALLAPTAPELVEIGIGTDAIFAVIIMTIVVVRIYHTVHTLDSNELMELKG